MADREVTFHPDAADAKAAYARYAARSPKAAALFLHHLDIAVTRVREAPEGWFRIRPSIHRYVFRKFPFSLIYRIRDNYIEVIAVAHHRRRPGYWRSRK